MLQKLKHKLTLICIIGTSTVITIITLIALRFSETQLNTRNQYALENNILNIIDHVQNNALSYSFLGELEVNNECIIDISTPSDSLSFPGSYLTGDRRKNLIGLAYETALNTYSNSSKRIFNATSQERMTFELHTNRTHYKVLVASTFCNDINYTITLIQDMTRRDKEIVFIRLVFIALTILGSILLGFFSYWFSGKAIRPIAISQKEQTDFVAAASHELRSPLAVIRTSTDELLEDENIKNNKYVHIISTECNQLTRLVSDLLFLSGTDSGHWHISPHPIEMDTLLIDVYDSFFSLAESKDHLLELELPNTRQPQILADSERITQAISILINNALAYTPPHTNITLLLENTADDVVVKLIDHGPGIPDAAKAHIFKRFYRLDASRHSSNHYGLGLSIAFEIVKHHHGHLTLEDTPGGGATFIISLPITQTIDS